MLNPKKLDEFIRKSLSNFTAQMVYSSYKFPLENRKKSWFALSGSQALMSNFEGTYNLLLEQSLLEENHENLVSIDKVTS